MELKIGCTGWSYAGWQESFYPKNLEQKNFLKFYSSIFDITEINSTYYKIPNQFITKKWFTDTPQDFVFSAKFPRKITHDHRLKNVKSLVDEFLSSLSPLRKKIIALLVQLPPSLSFEEAKPRIIELLQYLPSYYKFPIEGRHESWFTDDARDFLEENNLCQAWNEVEGVNNPARITSDFVYLRLIGDRSIPEDQFGKVIQDKTQMIQSWAKKLEKIKEKIPLVLALSNNHLEGFAPATANTLRTMLGLAKLEWHDKSQTSLSDFDGKKLHDLYRHSTKLIK